MRVYHVTRRTRLGSILRYGLNPRSRRAFSLMGEGRVPPKGRLYIFTDIGDAENWREDNVVDKMSDSDLVLLEITLPTGTRLFKDPAWEGFGMDTNYYFRDTVPPESIRVVEYPDEEVLETP